MFISALQRDSALYQGPRAKFAPRGPAPGMGAAPFSLDSLPFPT